MSDNLYDVRDNVYDVCDQTYAETDNVYDVRDKTSKKGVPVFREGVQTSREGDFVEFDSLPGSGAPVPALKTAVLLGDQYFAWPLKSSLPWNNSRSL